MSRKELTRLAVSLVGLASLLALTACLTGCSESDAKAGIQPFFDALGTGAAAAGMPWATPLLHSAGSMVSSLFGTDGALLAGGAALKHHHDFGLTPARRKKLAPVRDSHRLAKAAVKAASK